VVGTERVVKNEHERYFSNANTYACAVTRLCHTWQVSRIPNHSTHTLGSKTQVPGLFLCDSKR